MGKKTHLEVKPITLFTIKHNPTYCVTSFKRLNGTFTRNSTPVFISKSEVQSLKSQSRLKNAINWMLLFADKKKVYSKEHKKSFSFRLAFVTLTIPTRQKHTDKHIKEHMLQPFLYWLTRYYNCSYVWKAESQLNGNIHFHLTIDQYVPWRSIRAKWNSILAKYDYCKVFQDGSNDKGNAATQIKAVLSEKKCANDIGGYMSKKDEVNSKVQKAFEQFMQGLKGYTPEVKAAYNIITHGKSITTDKEHMLKVVLATYNYANVHCKYDPDEKKQDKQIYKRVIEGRLWGCSEALSNINIFIDETYPTFEKEEKIFFRQNKDIYNLGNKVIEREKLRVSKMDEAERIVLQKTDEDIENRYRFMKNVYIHPHLSTMKLGAELQRMIHQTKLERKFTKQKYFVDEWLN